MFPSHDPRTCVGVDLGIKRAFVTSEGVFGSRKEINKQLRKFQYQRAQLQRNKTKSTRRKLKQIRRKHRNISKDFTHRCANMILKTNADVIVMEWLRSLKKKSRGKYMNRRLHQWAHGELKTILEYKARTLGKRVVTVNPAYTSQRDYRDIPSGKRRGCRYYASDGVIMDADWQASMGIAKLANIPVSHCNPVLDGQAAVNQPNVGYALHKLTSHVR